jgi:hypothetical protein
VLKADLIFKEITAPHGRWCKSGHEAPATFRRDGPLAPDQPTKFFQVTSDKMPEVNGTYCELCLIVANAMSRRDLILSK